MPETQQTLLIQPPNEAPQINPETLATDGARRAVAVAFTVSFLALLVMVAAARATAGDNTTDAQVAASAAVVPPLMVEIQARAAIVVDIPSGKVLFAKEPDTPLPLASLTKTMLVDAVAPHLQAHERITIAREDVERGEGGGPDMGEVWRVDELIDFTLIASSNVGAEALSREAAGHIRAAYPNAPIEETTVWRMNEHAKEIGLTTTFFSNPTGLDISSSTSGAYGSARDMATLFGYLATHNAALFAATTKDGDHLASVDGRWRNAENTNDALGEIPELILGKTGLTDLAGGNLAVVFDVGPAHPVVVVVLGSSESGRFSDVRKLVTESRAFLTGSATKPL